MRNYFLMPALAILISLSFASHLNAEVKVDHYEGATPTSAANAWEIISQGESEVEKLLAQKKLSAQDLESIHKVTYSLESAIQYLGSDKSRDLASLAEEVEKLHLSSEKHNESDTRASFKRVQSLLQQTKKPSAVQ